jgi:ABC-2 type transport system ATP-binding protein
VVRSEILDIFLDIIQDEERAIFLSTHIISDLEKVADYVTLIKDGQLVFSKSADDLKYGYGILKCGQSDFARIDQSDMEGQRKGQFGHEVLVKNPETARRKYSGLTVDPAHIEDIMLFYVRSDAS